MNRDQLSESLKDPRFRLEKSGLYWIVTKKQDIRGRRKSDFEPFKPFDHQILLNKHLYDKGITRLLVPKARRMGFSTMINLAQLDSCLNNLDFHSRIVDMSEDDAKDKLVNRATKAWNQINDTIETGIETITHSGKELSWTNGSRFTASISGRGGDAAQFLHVSELGPIDFRDPARADEIVDGAFPAADGGIIVVESTAKGPQGHFKRLVDEALEVPKADRTQEDFWVLFFAWFDDPRHAISGNFDRIKPDTKKYLDDVERKAGVKLSPEQRLWYQITKARSKNIRYEYPSLLEECWEQPIEGAIYASKINRAREAGRLGQYRYDARYPVFTIWDLGAPQNTRCIMFQAIAAEIRIINAIAGGYDTNHKVMGPEDPSEWAKALNETGYNFNGHILPHDSKHKNSSGRTFYNDLADAGLKNLRIMAKRDDAAWQRINSTLGAFDRFVFNTENPNVGVLINHLSCYHTETLSDGVTIKDIPKGDWASHYSDAFGAIMEAEERGFLKGVPRPQTRHRRPASSSVTMQRYSAY